MPPREWRVRIEDIIAAAERTLSYTQGITVAQFRDDRRTLDAVSYSIVVIGEAANAVPEEVTRAAPHVPWTEIRGMRNKITHEYFDIDVTMLWQTVRADLPPPIEAMRALLQPGLS